MRQYTISPYISVGIAVVGSAVIAVTPVAPVAPPQWNADGPGVALATSYGDLFTNTWANVQSIADNTDWSAITDVFGKMFTDPFGVLAAFTSITPTITADLPLSLTVQLPPGLELAIAGMGAQALASQAFSDAAADLAAGDFAGLFNAPATIADAYLNGAQNVSLLDGIINIPILNGILAPVQNFEVNLNLLQLLDALGLGNLDLGDLNLQDLIDQIGLENLTLGNLLDGLGVGDDGLGDLLGLGSGITDLGGLLGFLGLGDLGLGSFSLTGILSGLGLDLDVDLNSLGLDDVLNAFGINTDINLGLGPFLEALGFGGLLDTSLGSLLGGLSGGVLTGITGALNSVLGGLINSLPLVGPLLSDVLGTVVLTPQNLIDALNVVTIGDLLGGQSIDETVGSLLAALGVALPTDDLTIGGILTGLGFADSTGDLTLGGLLGGLGGGLLGLDVTGLLNGLDLSDVISALGLDDLLLNLGDVLGDLTDLNLGELLDDLGLGNFDLAAVSVGSFGGMVSQLFEVVPQQILDALG
ncbi:hypothetical protein MU0083_001821 [[Mycobacterium] kokjensenii]|uniref:PE-PGRS family protein n=1 Tax=[Mycobacterium] kokjensenii TaxID=3064287 RepID=A0ABM9LF59_9MYCO|nr:hypothetical protein [Mycolicibacter sp. MU0083]CAJ1498016.1 hypothetical protein MU0083_001821 [Mycolicibacter sp. MU0083]